MKNKTMVIINVINIKLLLSLITICTLAGGYNVSYGVSNELNPLLPDVPGNRGENIRLNTPESEEREKNLPFVMYEEKHPETMNYTPESYKYSNNPTQNIEENEEEKEMRTMDIE